MLCILSAPKIPEVEKKRKGIYNIVQTCLNEDKCDF
jgi:hypothetical protein